MRLKKITAVTAGCAVMLGAAPAALAQTSAQTGYSQPGGVIQQQLTPPPAQTNAPAAAVSPATSAQPAAAKPAATRTLPFTGLDVALAVAAGGVLLGLGLGIRRLSRNGGTA